MRKFLAALLLGPLAAAPSQLPAPQTFKIGTKLVEVDVVARGKRGPVTRPGQGRLHSTRQRQAAGHRLLYREIGPRLAGQHGLCRHAPPLSPGVISNRPNPNEDAPATQTVLLLDRLFTNQVNQIIAIQRIGKFLDLRRKRDGIGIYSLGQNVRVIQDVTGDDLLLRRAANSLKAQNAGGRDSDTTRNDGKGSRGLFAAQHG